MKAEANFKHASASGMLIFEVNIEDVKWEIAIKPTKLVEGDLGVTSEYLESAEIIDRVKVAILNDARSRPDVLHKKYKGLKPISVEVF